MFTLTDGSEWDGLFPQVPGAAWGRDGLGLGQLAKPAGFCGVLPRMGDGEGNASGVLYECPQREGHFTSQVGVGCLDGLV
jgi:hypothetical protein